MVKLMYASGRDSNMYYQVRVEIPDPFFFLDLGKEKYVFLDHREYGVFAEVSENPSIKLVALEPLYEDAKKLPGEGFSAGKIAEVILQKYGVAQEEVFVPADFPVRLADFLRGRGVTLTPTTTLYPERILKSDSEVESLKSSLESTKKAFRRIEEILHASKIAGNEILWEGNVLTSEVLKLEVEKVFLEENMSNVEGIIISSGVQAAVPHHRGSGSILPNETIVCDIFPRSKDTGFFADMTRTYVKGEPSSEAEKMFQAVKVVQEKCIAFASPGKSFGEVHDLAVEEFKKFGYEPGVEGFTHSVGHGLGLDVHELPFAGSGEILKPGQVITVEPGLYYKKFGGVRIEDVILVTSEGSENLTNFPNVWRIN